MASGALFDPNMWYRLTNANLDVGGALAGDLDTNDDVLQTGYVDLDMQEVSYYTNQYWQISLNPNGFYNLCTSWLGPSFQLAYYLGNSSTYRPALDIGPFPDLLSQQWNITPTSDGAFSLSNPFIDPPPQTLLYIDVTGGVPGLDGSAVGNALEWCMTEVKLINNDTYSSISPDASTSNIMSSITHSTMTVEVSGSLISFERPTPSIEPPASSASAVSVASPTHPPTHSTTVASTTSIPPLPHDGRTSAVIAAGIGIGVAAGVLVFCALAGYLILRWHRKRRNGGSSETQQNHIDASPEHDEEGKAAAASLIEEKQYAGPQAVPSEDQELEGQHVSELGNSHMVGRIDGPNDVPELQ